MNELTTIDNLVLASGLGFAAGMRPGRAEPLLDPDVRAAEWLALDDAELAARKVPPAQRHRLLDPATRRSAQDLLRRTIDLGFGLVVRGGKTWPSRLRGLPSAPIALWYRGELTGIEETPCLAVVGTRTATPYGTQATRAFVEALAVAGLGVVSGLARGVDAEAHRTTLAAGGRTIAVLGSALDRVYPTEHEELAEEIVAGGGLLVSEYPPGCRARAGAFPRRNRIVAGLSVGVLVTEAGHRSGALITTDWALDYGRQVWAVPGAFHAPQSAGSHKLIREGAQLAESPSGLLADLGCTVPETSAPATIRSALEASVLGVLQRCPSVLDALVTETRSSAEEVQVALARLELAGFADCRLGGTWFATHAGSVDQPRRTTT